MDLRKGFFSSFLFYCILTLFFSSVIHCFAFYFKINLTYFLKVTCDNERCTGHLYLREQGDPWGSLEILDRQFAVPEKLQCLVSWSCKNW